MAAGGVVSNLSDSLARKAEKELNEHSSTRNKAIEELRKRIEEKSGDDELKEVQFDRKDDSFLLRFLRARKFDQERSLQLYINYYKNRRDYPDIFGEFTPQSVEGILKSGLISVLDQPAKNGAKIICARIIKWDTDSHSFLHVMRAIVLVIEKLLEDEETQVNGVSMFESFQDVGFGQMCRLAQYETTFRGVMVKILQDGLPVRLKSIHIIMQPFYIDMLMMLVWPFIKEKLKRRIHLHGYDMPSLHEFVDPANLPLEYEGSLPSLDNFLALRLFSRELAMNNGTEV